MVDGRESRVGCGGGLCFGVRLAGVSVKGDFARGRAKQHARARAVPGADEGTGKASRAKRDRGALLGLYMSLWSCQVVWPLAAGPGIDVRACLKIRFRAAQATGPARRDETRRTERQTCFKPIKTDFSPHLVAPFRSASRRPGRAGRPCHPFFRQALKGGAEHPGRSWSCSTRGIYPGRLLH